MYILIEKTLLNIVRKSLTRNSDAEKMAEVFDEDFASKILLELDITVFFD